MSVQSAQDLNDSCQTFSSQLKAHHGTTTSLLSELTNHLSKWATDCERFIGSETARITEELEPHKTNLNALINWLEEHPAVVESFGQKAMDLFAAVAE